ncbi:hypothetical protein [Trujillonella humicola]
MEVVLALGRWDEDDSAVSASEVEPVDVLGDGDGDLKVVLALPWAAVAV